MPIQTIEPRRLYRRIADQLRSLIEHGEYAVGTRLPPERDLAAQLGVSRPSVREALIALEVEGLVEVRMGSGKGTPEYWVVRVKPGRILFEIDGVSQQIAREALTLAAAKLPIKTRFIERIAG